MIDVDGLSIVTVETITETIFWGRKQKTLLGSLQLRKKYSLFRCKRKKKYLIYIFSQFAEFKNFENSPKPIVTIYRLQFFFFLMF